MSRFIHYSCFALLAALLSACGGSGGDISTSGFEASDQQGGSQTGSNSSSGDSGTSSAKFALTAQISTMNVAVNSLIKVSETRVSRTIFEYVFRVKVINTGSALTNIKGRVAAVGEGTTIVDGSFVVGDMEAGQTKTPADTITLRHDRTKAFDSSAWVWSFTGESEGGVLVPGILLPGALTDLASTHLETYTAPRTADDLQTTAAPSGATYYRTQIYAAIKSTATVEQVNNALIAVGGRIGFIDKNSPVVTIQVPDPGSIPALQGIANALVNSGAFSSASLVAQIGPDAIPSDPENITQAQAITPGGPVFHHLAARFGGLWNLRNIEVAPSSVQLVVVDYFGDGLASGLAGAASGYKNGLLCANPVTKTPNSVKCVHGYHVLGIMAGSFGGESSDSERVTGASPFPLKIHVVDISGGLNNLMFEEYLGRALAEIVTKAPHSKYVMNMSLGRQCSRPTGDCWSSSEASEAARLWRKRMRNIWPKLPVTRPFNYDEQFVQVTSAGNQGATASAVLNSPWNAAVLLGPLGDDAPLKNGLVVENRTAKLERGIPVVGVLSASSTVGGNIAAVGTDVFSLTGPSTAGRLSGTSMASPQVAGLVATMFAVRPTTPASDIVTKVINKRFVEDLSPTPAIDAYAAVLSMDNDMADAPVRQAILRASVTSPGPGSKQLMSFADVLMFLKAYFPSAYEIPQKLQPAFSRFDLNGDGYDGEVAKTAPLDMQFDGIGHKFVPQTIEHYTSTGFPRIKLDEAAATDFQILCYYINSPLFDAAQKAMVDAELANLSQPSKLNRKISCNDQTVFLEVKDLSLGWSGLPASITLKSFATPFPATFTGNSSTCTNQGAIAGERGFPFFSANVPSPVQIFAALDVTGVPMPLNGGTINRRNCSSFFAQAASQVWINATGRAVFGFGLAVSDWEYQVRYTNGLNNIGKRCSIGIVPNSNFFSPSFEAASCSHDVTATVTE